MTLTVKVKDMLDQNIVSVESSASVMDALKMMINNKVWSVIVTKEKLPVGLVTERDILRRCVAKGLVPDKVKVEEIMSSPLITIKKDATIGEALELMVRKGIRRLFIVEEGKIIGRVTQTGLSTKMLDIGLTLQGLLSTI